MCEWFIVNAIPAEEHFSVCARFLYANDAYDDLYLLIEGQEYSLPVTGLTPRIVTARLPKKETYRRFSYAVKRGRRVLLNGEYPLIQRSCATDLRLCFYSCNDAASAREGLKPHWHNFWKWKLQKSDPSLWSVAYKSDAIVCMGDFIYADSVYEAYEAGSISLSEVKRRLTTLYRLALTEPAQQAAMTTALNLGILDDHEVTDHYGTPGKGRTLEDARFAPYAEAALEVYRAHVGALVGPAGRHNARDEGYAVSIGKYNFVCVDMRTEYGRTGKVFTPSVVRAALRGYSSECTNFMVLPRPIDFVTPLIAKFASAVMNVPDFRDLPSHSANVKGLFVFAAVCALLPRVHIVAGDVHMCYSSKILGVRQSVASGINVPTPTWNRARLNLALWLSSLDPLLPRKRELSHDNNILIYDHGEMTLVRKTR
jgi:hypothetical protein